MTASLANPHSHPVQLSRGRSVWVEFTANYVQGGFSDLCQRGLFRRQGRDVVFRPNPLWPGGPQLHSQPLDHLDHDQLVTGSFGASYLWKRDDGSTRFYVDALYGSGLRTDATAPDGSTIPNGGTVPAYYSVSLGVEEGFMIRGKERLKARFDVVNVTDNIFELRDGAGIGSTRRNSGCASVSSAASPTCF